MTRGLLAGLLACWGFSLSAAAAADIQVVKAGHVYGAVYGYRVEDAFYIGAKDAAQIYGGSLYWHAVRNQVQLSVRGRQAVFQADSDEASIDGKAVKMPKAMIVRTGQAFLPMSFLSSPDFSGLSGFETKFDPGASLLTVNPAGSVGPTRWFTYGDHTRIVLELKDGLRYSTARRGAAGFDVSVALGTIAAPETVPVNDGVVEAFSLEQEEKLARLAVKLQLGAKDWSLQELAGPRRLVVDIARREPAAAKAAVQAAAPAPPPVPVENPKPARRRIAVDAGHGGKDSGALGRGIREKDINLSAARELAKLLKESGKFDVLLTRDSDVFVPLGDRSRKANEYNADLFVSLHCNAHHSRSETGYEVYFLSERASDPEAERLAEFENSVRALEDKGQDDATNLLYALARTEFINDSAELAGLAAKDLGHRVDLSDRGVKQASFYVLRGTNSPAVLVEMGFVSNSKDAAKLNSRKYRRRIVEGVYAGILDFARRKEWVAARKP